MTDWRKHYLVTSRGKVGKIHAVWIEDGPNGERRGVALCGVMDVGDGGWGKTHKPITCTRCRAWQSLSRGGPYGLDAPV